MAIERVVKTNKLQSTTHQMAARCLSKSATRSRVWLQDRRGSEGVRRSEALGRRVGGHGREDKVLRGGRGGRLQAAVGRGPVPECIAKVGLWQDPEEGPGGPIQRKYSSRQIPTLTVRFVARGNGS